MRQIHTLPLLAVVIVAGACISVPRDGGLADVRTTVLERGRGAIEWPSDADEARVAELLAGELTADRAVAIAIANNPRMHVMLSDLELAHADLLEASTIPNPILELEWREPADPYHPYEITVAQSVLELLRLPRRRAAGRAAFEAATRRVAADVLAFAAGVRDDYYALLAATQRLAFSRTATEAVRVAAELAIRQHTAGNITDLDLERRQADYERAKLMLATDEEEVLVAREALIRDMGLRTADGSWSVPADFPALPESEPDFAELESRLEERRLDLIVAARELEALRRLLPGSRLEEIGEVVVDFHREREPSGEKTTGPGIELPIPIFNRGAASRARASAALTRAEQGLELLAITAASEVRIARQRLLAARARLEYYRDVIVPRQARIVELTKLEHNSMLLGTYELLQTRRDELEVRREYADAQHEYWIARNDLDRALNGVAGGGALDVHAQRRPTGATAREGGH